jgi:chromosome segregation ATPase
MLYYRDLLQLRQLFFKTESKATDFEASEILLQKLRADEIITQQEIFCLQTDVDRLNEKKRRWAVEHQKLTSSREFQQFKTMCTLIGKLSAMKHRLTQSEQGYENCQRKYLERVSIQLEALHKAYLKTEKSWLTISKQAETLENKLHSFEKETKKKALQMVNLKNRLSQIRMQREIEDLERECVYLCGQI